MIQELASDPYVPPIGSLPAHATYQQAQDWVDRQNGRLAEGTGYSFAITEADTDCDRGRGFAADALLALTAFAWSIPRLHRIELYIEPWNTGSVKTAGRAGYEREGLLRSHQESAAAAVTCCCTRSSERASPASKSRRNHSKG
jgi:ribosomal-protein-alanine N-acetyltransferase